MFPFLMCLKIDFYVMNNKPRGMYYLKWIAHGKSKNETHVNVMHGRGFESRGIQVSSYCVLEGRAKFFDCCLFYVRPSDFVST